jgi:hypothetical protein
MLYQYGVIESIERLGIDFGNGTITQLLPFLTVYEIVEQVLRMTSWKRIYWTYLARITSH